MKLELQPTLINQKSYYGKAWIEIDEKGIYLYSYDTLVFKHIKGVGGFLQKDINLSATTLKHIKEFIFKLYDEKGLTKKDIIKKYSK